jgi:A/G-specific adenine glycosylase
MGQAYPVWISEVMLQQTRVAVVAKAFPAFLARFPSLARLAAADVEEVLAAWSGLGYYARARNLHRAARWLVERGYRDFPRDYATARRLPGVGPYTAAAVLSIAYGHRLAAVEANVRRVFRRVFALGLETHRGVATQALANALLVPRAPGDWNQALMELGQRLCTPRAPKCSSCPWQLRCASARALARAEPPQTRAPVGPRDHIHLVAELVFDPAGRLLVERGAFPYLKHLWLPLLRRGAADAKASEQADAVLGEFRHAIVRRQFRVRVVERTVSRAQARALVRRTSDSIERRLVTPEELEQLGRSSLLLKAWALRVKSARRGSVELEHALQ